MSLVTTDSSNKQALRADRPDLSTDRHGSVTCEPGIDRPLRTTSPARSRISAQRILYLFDLLIELVTREMKLLYKRSSLGILWSFIKPLLQLGVLYFVFHSILTFKVPHYASFLCCGLLAWSWFQSSLTYAADTITNNQSLLRHPSFSPSILPIVVVTTWLIHFLLALPTLGILFLFDGLSIPGTFALLPAIIAIQFVATLTLAYPLAALQVSFRDIQHILNVVLGLMFYFTPIVYALSSVPEKYTWLFAVNPMAILITSYRDILINGTQPHWAPLLVLLALSCCLLPLSQLWFKACSLRFVEEL
jgi:lipopolysaccharide transport system permease protein